MMRTFKKPDFAVHCGKSKDMPKVTKVTKVTDGERKKWSSQSPALTHQRVRRVPSWSNSSDDILMSLQIRIFANYSIKEIYDIDMGALI